MSEYIIDKVRQRTSSWSEKFLSQAGKDILIKFVALSMHVFSMSCFKLSTHIMDEINTILMRFLWRKGDKIKGIPWVAWKKMQFSKKQEGVGFRDLAKFNEALLAKQAWRLIRNHQTLLARLMKARYYRNSSLLDAKNRKNQSYGWSSVLTGLELIKKGVRYIIAR